MGLKLIDLRPQQIFKRIIPGSNLPLRAVYQVLVKYSKERISVKNLQTGETEIFSGEQEVRTVL